MLKYADKYIFEQNKVGQLKVFHIKRFTEPFFKPNINMSENPIPKDKNEFIEPKASEYLEPNPPVKVHKYTSTPDIYFHTNKTPVSDGGAYYGLGCINGTRQDNTQDAISKQLDAMQ